MFKKIIAIVPVAAMLTVGATAQASTITVQKGDTLWDLARANNTTVETIQTVNHLTGDLIHPGDLLTITQEKQYKVKLGDTLWDIAIDHDVTVSQIKEWNNLYSDLIHPGLNLVIYEGTKASNKTVSEKSSVTAAAPVQTPKVTAPATNNKESDEGTSEVTAPAASNESTQQSAPVASAQAPSNSIASDNEIEETAPATSNETSTENKTETSAPAVNNAGEKTISVQATAYTASCEGCSGITSTGINLKENPDAKVISVDPTVIPLGSKVYVEGYGEAIAGDTGGGIKGNKIDVFIASKEEAIKFGVKQLDVTILE